MPAVAEERLRGLEGLEERLEGDRNERLEGLKLSVSGTEINRPAGAVDRSSSRYDEVEPDTPHQPDPDQGVLSRDLSDDPAPGQGSNFDVLLGSDEELGLAMGDADGGGGGGACRRGAAGGKADG